jgi:hypothetical protein
MTVAMTVSSGSKLCVTPSPAGQPQSNYQFAAVEAYHKP